MEKKKVILVFDNTITHWRKDIDDALAFFYLYGNRDKVDLLGVCTTHGNMDVDFTFTETVNMMEKTGVTDVTVYKGMSTAAEQSPAVDFMVEQVNLYPGEITIISVGATTNMYGAYLKDNSFYSKLKRIIFMGGYTAELVLGKRKVSEINFSHDYEATCHILKSGVPAAILTGQFTLQALFSSEDYRNHMKHKKTKLYRYLRPYIKRWILLMKLAINTDGFYNWDTAAAIYLLRPELFTGSVKPVRIRKEELKHGYIEILAEYDRNDPDVVMVDVPDQINDLAEFNREFIKGLDAVVLP